MALELQRELASGSIGNYFSISKIDITDNKMKIMLNLHVSKDMKIAGKSPLVTEIVNIDHVKSNTILGNVYAIAYAGIKESCIVDGVECNEFVSALDV